MAKTDLKALANLVGPLRSKHFTAVTYSSVPAEYTFKINNLVSLQTEIRIGATGALATDTLIRPYATERVGMSIPGGYICSLGYAAYDSQSRTARVSIRDHIKHLWSLQEVNTRLADVDVSQWNIEYWSIFLGILDATIRNQMNFAHV